MAKVILDQQGDTERLLEQLPIDLRGRAQKMAVRAAGRKVANRAKQLAPKPGYPGDLPDKIALRDTIKVVVRDYGETAVAVVGPTYPAGAHGHLVEEGHELVAWGRETGAFVPGKEFLAPAADQTLEAQDQAYRNKLKERIERVS